jgi:hypothetical protein
MSDNVSEEEVDAINALIKEVRDHQAFPNFQNFFVLISFLDSYQG